MAMQGNNENEQYWLTADWNDSTIMDPDFSPMFDDHFFSMEGSVNTFDDRWDSSSFECSPLSSSTGPDNKRDLHKYDSYRTHGARLFDAVSLEFNEFDLKWADGLGWITDNFATDQNSNLNESPVIDAFPSDWEMKLVLKSGDGPLEEFENRNNTPRLPRPIKTSIHSKLTTDVISLNEYSNVVPKASISNKKMVPALPQLPRQRFSDNSTPSKYCHICGRNGRYVALRACQYYTQSLCRKVVCAVCISRYDQQHELKVRTCQGQWVCTHCRGACPKRARCVQYFRNNEKRRAKNIEKRKLKTNPDPGSLQDQHPSKGQFKV